MHHIAISNGSGSFIASPQNPWSSLPLKNLYCVYKSRSIQCCRSHITPGGVNSPSHPPNYVSQLVLVTTSAGKQRFKGFASSGMPMAPVKTPLFLVQLVMAMAEFASNHCSFPYLAVKLGRWDPM